MLPAMIKKTILTLAILGWALTGCRGPASSHSADEEVHGSGPKFHHDIQSALAEAKQTNKPIVAIFSASWCGPCQMMKKKVYPSAEVAPYVDKFVWAYLDADLPANRDLMESHGVNGIPHIGFVSPDGKKLGQSVVGYTEPKEFASILAKVAG